MILLISLLIFVEFGCYAFHPTHEKAIMQPKCRNTALNLTPIGPFCHFRSSASVEAEPKMEELYEQAPDFATDMAKVQSDMQIGGQPDKALLFRVADGIDQAVDQWETLLAQLKSSGDFQTIEYRKLVDVHLSKHGVTPTSISSMMRWQGRCMRALALNSPPPMPPTDLDLASMMNNAGGKESTPSLNRMTNAQKITSCPFNESAFKNEAIRDEFEKLCRDHNELIESGAKYSEFDPKDKIIFVGQIEEIEDRWDIFYTRFSLMDELNPDFVEQCNDFLESMNLNEKEYRKLLKGAHIAMQKNAEREEEYYS